MALNLHWTWARFDDLGVHALHDALVQWGGIRNLTLSIGIRNLFDRDPPQSLQFTTFQAGYDPRFTDPSGRVLALRAGYRF